MSDQERQAVLDVRDKEFGKATVHDTDYVDGADDVDRAAGIHGSVTWITTSPDGPPMLVQVALGSHNFEVVPAPGP
jgi:hypothetical protein